MPIIRLEPELHTIGRWLTELEITQLIAAASAHLQPMIRFALATGLRKSNILQLR